jgi:cytochrome c oxidase assembly protein subunit 15
MTAFFRTLVAATAALTFVVIVAGGYVRLSDAGLGCPDWPLCYGNPVPHQITDPGALAKAWKEMGHRYLAGALGALIFLVALLSWKNRRSPGIATAILAVVAAQAALGMWTVTLLLKPAIVTAHLLGGMTTLALLILLFLRQGRYSPAPELRSLRVLAGLSLAAVAVQIALGGWVSANYAALACPDLPACMGQVFPPMDFANAFHVLRDLGRTREGELLSLQALTAIHWTHRLFALLVLGAVGFLAFRASRLPALRGVALAAGILVALQFLLGVANVALGLPLPLAAAHNAGAALLLASLVVLNFFVYSGLSSSK